MVGEVSHTRGHLKSTNLNKLDMSSSLFKQRKAHMDLMHTLYCDASATVNAINYLDSSPDGADSIKLSIISDCPHEKDIHGTRTGLGSAIPVKPSHQMR